MACFMIFVTGCGGGGATQVQEISQTDPPPPPPPPPPVQHFAIPTYHNDNTRSGINSLETVLTPANVNVVSFGKRAVVPVQGYVFAQPLYISNVTMSDGKAHNLVIVATEHDQVYGIDADTYQVMWQRSLLDSQGQVTPIPTSDVNCGVLGDEVGITGTPVIDAPGETVYLVAATKNTQNGQASYEQKIYALNLTNGQDRVPAAIITTPTGNYGSARFSPLLNLQRSALLLENGNVYVSWASHCDYGAYSGWLMAFNAGSLQLSMAWTPDPSGLQGGIWMSGGGASVDASGNIFLSVGNGWSDAPSGGANYGDSAVRLTATGGQIAVADYFMPYDYTMLMNDDLDLGSGTPLLLPTQTGARYPNLMVTGGKEGTIYLLNRDNLGQWHANDDTQVVQSFQVPSGIFDTPLFWNNTLYYGLTDSPMQAFAYDPAAQQINTTPVSVSSMNLSYPGSSPTLSSNNGSNAILWSLEAAADQGIFRAFDANNLSNELYDSEMSPDRDRVGGGVRFTSPMVANGQVFVGAQGELDIYGEFSP
jgi:hypothetical protein